MTAVADHENVADGADREVAAARYAATGDLATARVRMLNTSPNHFFLSPAAREKLWKAGAAQRQALDRMKGIKTPWVMPTLQQEISWTSPLGFCRRVMHNIVIDWARAQRRRPRELELHEGFDGGDPRSGDPAMAVELRLALFSALGTLTAQQRTIVVLRYFDDRSENEVAALLGVSTGTIKSGASRAMAQLRTHPALALP